MIEVWEVRINKNKKELNKKDYVIDKELNDTNDRSNYHLTKEDLKTRNNNMLHNIQKTQGN